MDTDTDLEQEKRERELKKKEERKLAIWITLISIVGLFSLAVYDSMHYPKLFEFGVNDWSVECANDERQYRLFSHNYHSHQNTRNITNRALSFLDESGDRLYQTRKFDEESLDKSGVWRFYYGKDVRGLVKKDESILWGDEVRFEVDENFRWLKVILKSGEPIQLGCRRTT